MEFKRITPDQYADVIRHLRKTFFVDEPLNKAAKLCDRNEGNLELEQHSISTLDDNFSIMAVDENDEVAGVILNGILKNGDIEKSQKKLQDCPDENFKKIFHFLYKANLQTDLFAHFEVEKIFDSRILSVDSKYRGQGIASELMQRSEKLAKAEGFKVIKGDATGIYSQKILRSQGYEKCAELFYKDHVDDTGKPILDVDEPHKSLQVMCKILN